MRKPVSPPLASMASAEEWKRQNRTTVTVEVTMAIHDEGVFRRVAYDQAIKDGLHVIDAMEYLNPEHKSLGECAAMVIDPGLSPDGCDILGSDWSETIIGERGTIA